MPSSAPDSAPDSAALGAPVDGDSISSTNAPKSDGNARSLGLLCVTIGLYSLFVIVTLLRGVLPINMVHLLLAPVPVALALWYGYGFMQPSQPSQDDAENTPDYGLLLLCAGWGLVALSLVVPRDATNVGNALNVTATVCGVLGLLCIVLGTVLSLRAWNETVRRS